MASAGALDKEKVPAAELAMLEEDDEFEEFEEDGAPPPPGSPPASLIGANPQGSRNTASPGRRR